MIKNKVAVLVLCLFVSMTWLTAVGPAAADVPSPAADTAIAGDQPDVEAAREVVAGLLRDHGLTNEQVEQRLAALSDEDVLQLSQHADQIQEGGAPPNYIWILLGALIVVVILATIF